MNNPLRTLDNKLVVCRGIEEIVRVSRRQAMLIFWAHELIARRGWFGDWIVGRILRRAFGTPIAEMTVMEDGKTAKYARTDNLADYMILGDVDE